MKRKFKAGLTSVSLPVFIADTSSTTGGGLSGVTSASSGLVLEYRRAGQSSWTSATPVSGKTLGTFLSWGIVADGSLAGAYEVDFPDAAFAAGARMVVCRIRGVTNMLPVLIEIELDAVDYQDAAAFGLSRLDQNVGSRMASYTQPTGFLAATFPTTVASPTNITSASGVVLAAQTHTGAVIPTVTSVGSVSGNVGAISGVTFPTHFDNLAIDPNGHVTATVDSINNNAITASSIQANAITSAKIASGAITSAAFAADAITETAFASGAISARVIADNAIDAASIVTGALNGKGDWLTTLGANAPANWINAAAIATDAIDGDALAASAISKITVNLFKYGDIQLWTSPANQIQVTITKV